MRELARRLHTSADEVNGFYVGLHALGLVQRIHDADGGRWERTADAPRTPLKMLERLTEAGIDIEKALRWVDVPN